MLIRTGVTPFVNLGVPPVAGQEMLASCHLHPTEREREHGDERTPEQANDVILHEGTDLNVRGPCINLAAIS
jgi:hypothetical protein